MKANETDLKKVIEGTTQFFVPHYQRPYSWQSKQWIQLWDDLIALTTERIATSEGGSAPTHFIGSMVTMPGASVPQGVGKYVLIDGQQRITTIMILLAAIRDVAREMWDIRRADMVHNLYLTNQYQDGQEHFKLLPTEGEDPERSDRRAFTRLVCPDDGERNPEHPTAVAYEFFAKRIRSDAPDLAKLTESITDGLVIVSIVLDRDDNPYTIFESLNAKGRPLSQSDLIRNYFFMRIHQGEHDKAYRQYWRPLEKMLGDMDMTEFFRQYLMREGNPVKIDSVYVELKRNTDRRGHPGPIAQLQEIHRYADYYSRIMEPMKEGAPAVRSALANLRRLNFGVTASFLLNLYDDYAQKRITARVMTEALETLENFLLRRFICGIPTNVLNKLFPVLHRQASANGDGKFSLDRLKQLLEERGYPSDEQFVSRLVDFRLYGGGDRRERARYILDRLEESFEHKEVVSKGPLQIEHVMPQTLSAAWYEVLGADAEDEYDDFLHRLGNLTLTGYNPEMSNAPYSEKRKQLIRSHVELNRYFERIDVWDFDAIARRSQVLAQRALRVWPSFSVRATENKRTMKQVTGTKPTLLRIGNEKHEVKGWSEVLDKVMRHLNDTYPERFRTLMEDYPNYLSMDCRRHRTPRSVGNGYYYEANLSAQGIFKLCAHVLQLAERGDDWDVDIRDA